LCTLTCTYAECAFSSDQRFLIGCGLGGRPVRCPRPHPQRDANLRMGAVATSAMAAVARRRVHTRVTRTQSV
jgi:hypothetical protein